MPDEGGEIRRIQWSEVFGFTQIFRGFRIAIDHRKLFVAAAAIVIVYAAGRAFDAMWGVGSSVVADAAGVTELQQFRASGFSRGATREWIDSVRQSGKFSTLGVFQVLLDHARGVAHQITHAALAFDVPGLIAALTAILAAFLWLVMLHPLYALLFGLLAAVIKCFAAGAICRMAALDATREERAGLGDALRFARQKFASFFAAPLLPLALSAIIGLFMLLGGLLGAIPGLGTLLAPLLWFLALLGGFLIAGIVILLALGAPLMYPTIAVEGSDAFDAVSRSFSYVFERIWRAALYAAVALLYGSICFLFVKLFARVMLFFTHFFVGLGMNLGSAAGAGGDATRKLDAMWKAPALDFSTPFYGQFGHVDLSGASAVGAWLVAFWTFLVVALVGGFLMSYFFSASTLIYLLLRRDVDATDLEEVYLEEEEAASGDAASGTAPAGGPPAEGPPPGSLGSLPVVGQTPPAQT